MAYQESGSTEVISDVFGISVLKNIFYTNVFASPTTANISGTYTAGSGNACENLTLTGNCVISPNGFGASEGTTVQLLIDRNTFTLSFGSVVWPEGGTAPSFSSYRYWAVYLIRFGSTWRASAIGWAS